MDDGAATSAEEVRDVTVRRLNDIEYFHHGAYGRLRAELGVRAFGIQVVRLEANSKVYPEHDHIHDGQEEVYLTLSGKATLIVGDQTYPLESSVAVRVGPQEMRRVVTDDLPVQLVVVGGPPGRVYTPSPYTELGAALAVASASATSVRVGQVVAFDGSESTAGAGADEVVHEWDFEGTGSFAKMGARPTYCYSRPGTFVAKLRITDDAGGVDMDKIQIHVDA